MTVQLRPSFIPTSSDHDSSTDFAPQRGVPTGAATVGGASNEAPADTFEGAPANPIGLTLDAAVSQDTFRPAAAANLEFLSPSEADALNWIANQLAADPTNAEALDALFELVKEVGARVPTAEAAIYQGVMESIGSGQQADTLAALIGHQDMVQRAVDSAQGVSDVLAMVAELEAKGQEVVGVFEEVFGIEVSPDQIPGAVELYTNGDKTLAELRTMFEQAKTLIDPADNELRRYFEIDAIRAELGDAGGGSIDKIKDGGTSANCSKENARSIAGQVYRFLEIAELMEQGLLPEGVFDVTGMFTHGHWDRIENDKIEGRVYEGDVILEAQQGGGNRQRIWVGVEDLTAEKAREVAERVYGTAPETGSPVALDLNHNGQIDTTGVSTAKDRVDGQVGSMVEFDIDGDGETERVEWMQGTGDGLLVDNRDGGATAAMASGANITGERLFGDQGGKYENGYEKLAQFDTNGDGKLTGEELEGLEVWVDDGDAVLEEGELKRLAELGITEISVEMGVRENERGEQLMQSSFVQNGEQHLTEDVWFAEREVSNAGEGGTYNWQLELERLRSMLPGQVDIPEVVSTTNLHHLLPAMESMPFAAYVGELQAYATKVDEAREHATRELQRRRSAMMELAGRIQAQLANRASSHPGE